MALVLSSNFFKQELCVRWTVKVDDFLNGASTEQYDVRSDTFSADFSEGHKWQLSLYDSTPIDVSKRTGIEYYSISLDQPEYSENHVNIQTTYNSIGRDGKNIQLSSIHRHYEGWDEVCNISEELSRDQWKELIVDGHLQIKVVIKYLDVSAHVDVFQRLKSYYDLIDNVNADFKIVTSDALAIGVHKLILENAWPHFATMVNSRMEESKENKWVMKDYDYKTIKIIVVFMYTGYLKLENVQVALCVLKAANQYLIDNLVTRAEHFIKQNIKMEHVLEILSTAVLLGLKDLKKACFEKIVSERKDPNSKYKTLNILPGFEGFSSTASRELLIELIGKLYIV